MAIIDPGAEYEILRFAAEAAEFAAVALSKVRGGDVTVMRTQLADLLQLGQTTLANLPDPDATAAHGGKPTL